MSVLKWIQDKLMKSDICCIVLYSTRCGVSQWLIINRVIVTERVDLTCSGKSSKSQFVLEVHDTEHGDIGYHNVVKRPQQGQSTNTAGPESRNLSVLWE